MNPGGMTIDRTILWDKVQSVLRQEIPERQFRFYVETATLVPPDESGADLILKVPDNESALWFSNVAASRIEQLAGNQLYPGKLVVKVSRQPDLFVADGAPESPPMEAAALPLENKVHPAPAATTEQAPAPAQKKPSAKASRSGLSRLYTFENYYSGPSNEIALAAGMKLATEAGAASTTSPLFIQGSVGLGKSHLAHAIGARFLECNPDANLRLLSGEQFMREVQQAFLNDRIQEFREGFRQLSMLIIDDIQMIGRDSEQTHKQFLGLFNYMNERELPIVLTSDRPAARLSRRMPSRLVSRITMGVDVTIGVPDLDTRIGILSYQARALFGMDLHSETARLVATQLRSNCRELVGALRRMALQADHAGTKITPEIARHVLRDIVSVPRNLTVHEIIEQTAKHHKLRAADLVSKRRAKDLVRARHVAMYMCRELTQVSLPTIGDAFGCHHSSVIHACRKVSESLHKDQDLAYEITALRQELSS